MSEKVTPREAIASKNSPNGPKNSPKGPKKVQKRTKMWPNLKLKVRAVLPKPKLNVYLGESPQNF